VTGQPGRSAGGRWPPGVVIPDDDGWPVVLRAGALVLRPMYRGDDDAWTDLRARNREWLQPWEATSPPEAGLWRQTVPQMRRQQWQWARAGTSRNWVMAWDAGWPAQEAPVRRTRLIGSVTVAGITWGSLRCASVGYWIGQDWAGRGLTPLAVALAGDYCLSVLRLHRLQIDVRPENVRSLRVVAKLGLRSEGLKVRYLHIAGAWADHVAFAIDADEVNGSLVARALTGRGVPTGDAV